MPVPGFQVLSLGANGDARLKVMDAPRLQLCPPPSQQRTLNTLLTELRCRNFVNKHRLSIQIGAKRAKTWYAVSTYFNGACIPQLVVGHPFL